MKKSNFKFIAMQGRLLKQTEESIQYFPDDWETEFPLIRDLNFDGIEWIYDNNSEKTNPITSKNGRMQIIEISKKFNIYPENIVLDWFIPNSMFSRKFSINEIVERLEKLIDYSAEVGFHRIILPLLEENSIKNMNDHKKFLSIVNRILEVLHKNKIELHLETSLHPSKEAKLLNEIDDEKICLCFDMGNSASMGFDPTDTLNLIKPYLGSVHIKDRKLNGPTVPLGTGSVNFLDVFSMLNEVNFQGPLTFQIYRDKFSDNMKVMKHALTFINNIIEGYDSE